MAAPTPLRSIAALGEESLREDAGTATANMDETAWTVSRLSVVGLKRLSTFLTDLAQRAPLDGPAWAPHRMVIEALEADVRRELEARKGEK